MKQLLKQENGIDIFFDPETNLFSYTNNGMEVSHKSLTHILANIKNFKTMENFYNDYIGKEACIYFVSTTPSTYYKGNISNIKKVDSNTLEVTLNVDDNSIIFHYHKKDHSLTKGKSLNKGYISFDNFDYYELVVKKINDFNVQVDELFRLRDELSNQVNSHKDKILANTSELTK
jgi:hypothetical protein